MRIVRSVSWCGHAVASRRDLRACAAADSLGFEQLNPGRRGLVALARFAPACREGGADPKLAQGTYPFCRKCAIACPVSPNTFVAVSVMNGLGVLRQAQMT